MILNKTRPVCGTICDQKNGSNERRERCSASRSPSPMKNGWDLRCLKKMACSSAKEVGMIADVARQHQYDRRPPSNAKADIEPGPNHLEHTSC